MCPARKHVCSKAYRLQRSWELQDLSASCSSRYAKSHLPLLQSALELKVVAHYRKAFNDNWQVEDVVVGRCVHAIEKRWWRRRWWWWWKKSAQACVFDLEVVDLSTEDMDLVG